MLKKWFTALVLLGGICGAQDSPPIDNPSHVRPATICGKVQNVTDGSEIRKATVNLFRSSGRVPTKTRTNENGEFCFLNVEPGRYQVSSYAPGFVFANSGTDLWTSVTVNPGQKLSGLTFGMLPAAVIRGHIFDDDGDPVGNALVTVLTKGTFLGRRGLVSVGTSNTDDRGEFRVPELRPGAYYVLATPPRSDSLTSNQALAVTYFVDTSRLAEAVVLQVEVGKEMAITMTMHKVEMAAVHGAISLSDDSPAEGGGLLLVPAETGIGVNFITAMGPRASVRNGHFQLRATPGRYRLSATAIGPSGSHEWLETTVDVAPGSNELNLRTEGLSLVTGAVNVQTVGNKTPLSGLVLQLLRWRDEPSLGISPGGAQGNVRANGSVDFGPVRSGTYSLSIFRRPAGAEDWYIRSILSSNEDALRSGVRVKAHAKVQIDVRIVTTGSRIEGTVRADGKPRVSVTVVAVPNSDLAAHMNEFPTGISDQNGLYSIRGLAPGTYTVYCLPQVELREWLDPEFLRNRKGTLVNLGESDFRKLDCEIGVNSKTAEVSPQ